MAPSTPPPTPAPPGRAHQRRQPDLAVHYLQLRRHQTGGCGKRRFHSHLHRLRRHLDGAHQRRQPLLAVHTSSSDGTKLAAAEYSGSIYTSTDSGATWTERTSAGSRYWQSITSNSDGTKLAAVAAYNGYIYTSTLRRHLDGSAPAPAIDGGIPLPTAQMALSLRRE